MFSPLHTHQASASARIPAEPQYWTENLPVGHGRYNSVILTFYHSDSLSQVLTMLEQLYTPLGWF